MEEQLDDGPECIDVDTLTPIVERVLGEHDVRITEWRCARLHGGNAGSIFRFLGYIQMQRHNTPWSVVLKIPSRDVGHADPYGGTREPVIYSSEGLHALPGSLVLPQCFGVVEQSNGEHWIWLEDVPHSTEPWDQDCYADVARRLGKFNGTFLSGYSLPSWPWLGTKSAIHDYLAVLWPTEDQLRDAIASWHNRSELPRSIADQLLQLHSERDLFLDKLDTLPITLCHGDAFQRNLLVDDSSRFPKQVVAIDWAWAGMGVLGEDLHRLVSNSSLFAYVAAEQLPRLDRIVMPAYIQGLREAGWQGNEQHVRFGFAASSALTEGIIIGGSGLQVCADEQNYQWIQDSFGWSKGDIPSRLFGMLRYQLDLAAEARDLMAVLD